MQDCMCCTVHTVPYIHTVQYSCHRWQLLFMPQHWSCCNTSVPVGKHETEVRGEKKEGFGRRLARASRRPFFLYLEYLCLVVVASTSHCPLVAELRRKIDFFFFLLQYISLLSTPSLTRRKTWKVSNGRKHQQIRGSLGRGKALYYVRIVLCRDGDNANRSTPALGFQRGMYPV
jgi:hypothetical protein